MFAKVDYACTQHSKHDITNSIPHVLRKREVVIYPYYVNLSCTFEMLLNTLSSVYLSKLTTPVSFFYITLFASITCLHLTLLELSQLFQFKVSSAFLFFKHIILVIILFRDVQHLLLMNFLKLVTFLLGMLLLELVLLYLILSLSVALSQSNTSASK